VKTKRKGQQDTKGASLIAIIVALIILYILFLPPDEREKLLKENTSSDNTGGVDEKSETILLREFVGTMDFFNDQVCDYDDANRFCTHLIPNVNLFDTKNSIEIARLNSAYVKNGWFEKEQKTFTFDITDLKNTENVELSFSAEKRSGRLIISLNGHVIQDAEIKGSTPGPIALPQDLLQSSNTLVFSVSSVGGSFWRTNEYLLADIKILGILVDKEKQEGSLAFSMKPTEVENIQRSWLEFYPTCDPRKVGVLKIKINDQNIFSAVPECETVNKQELKTEIFEDGSNDITFATDSGKYLIDKIKIKTEIKDTKKRTFYFELNKSEVKNIKNTDKQVNITFWFAFDDTERNDIDFKLNVNGHLAEIDNTKVNRGRREDRITQGYYSRIIDTWVEEGNNYVQIEPLTRIDIKEMRVSLFDVD
jgi:hypothetical protein